MYKFAKQAELDYLLNDNSMDCSDIDSNNNSTLIQNYLNNSLSSNDIDTNSLKLDELNDYVLFEIFNYLSISDILKIKLINKRFYYLATDYFSKLDQIMIYINQDNKGFETCNDHKQTEFNSIQSIDNMDNFLNKFLIKLTRLKVLNLSFLTINEYDLQALTNLQCIGTTLIHLEISRCKFENFYLSAQSTYENFFKKLGHKLEHFIYYKNSSYLIPMNNLLKLINKYLSNLNTLVLDLKQYEKNFVSSNQYLQNCTKLKHLNLHGLYWPLNQSMDKFFVELINGKSIDHLNLKCLRINQNKLFYIIHNCLNLKVLKFSYDFSDDNKFGRQLITKNSVFSLPYFRQYIQDLREEGKIVQQFELANAILSLKQLEELHFNEIISCNVNIDPLILYLYHYYKRNNLRKLVITNYEVHLMNLKAFCYVSRKLKVLKLNDLTNCPYKTDQYRLSERLARTVNESFTETITYLYDLQELSLNHCNFDYKILKLLLIKCESKVIRFSFIGCKQFNVNCIDLFIIYANTNSNQMIDVKLDDDLIQRIENEVAPLFNICPSNLNIISC